MPALLLATTAPAVLDFDAIYAQHVQRVARWTARLAGPRADVEDLVQDVFLRIHRRLPTFRGDSELSTWIYAITENVVRSWRRRDWLKRRLGLGDTGPAADAQLLRVPSGQPDPAEALTRRRSATRIYRELDRLRESYRTVFILFEIEGMSGREIGQLVGIKEQTVWVRLNRARTKLAARLRRDEE